MSSAVDSVDERLQVVLGQGYRIDREVGRGGMAIVYRAEDFRHERTVAIKVLRPELALTIGSERFLREIKHTARLAHPHILPLLDSGEAEGLVYYVMPYVEGESLRERLQREKMIPIGDAIHIAREVADALSHAHKHGLVHRDIKPENILLQGKHAVVADFGIAKAISESVDDRLTGTGAAIGTPQYMSPEQIAGRQNVDGRCDVYALGCVMYEMLGGQPPFTGNTKEVVAKALTSPPRPLSQLRESVPRNIEAAVHTALASLEADRFATIADFADALTNPKFGTDKQPIGQRKTWRHRIAIPLVGLVAVLAVLNILLVRSRTAAPASPTRFAIGLPEGFELVRGGQSAAEVSPDGKTIAFLAYNKRAVGASFHPDAVSRHAQIFVRSLDALDARVLEGTEGATRPFFSADGRWLAFWQHGAIRKVPVSGGAPIAIAEVSDLAGASWGPDNMIVFSSVNNLFQVPATGVIRPSLVPVSDSTIALREPEILPGGFAALAVAGLKDSMRDAVWPVGEIAVINPQSGRVKRLGMNGRRPRYVQGYMLFRDTSGLLLAAPFDARRQRVEPDRIPIVDNPEWDMAFGVSAAGVLAYIRRTSHDSSQLEWVDRKGVTKPIDSTWVGQFASPVLSPDGTQLAVNTIGSLWTRSLQTGALSIIARCRCYRLEWAGDGRSITFVGIARGLMTSAVDASTSPQLLLPHSRVAEGFWSPDRRWLIYRTENVPSGKADILARSATDTVTVELIATSAEETSPVLSADGRWLAYVSDETGRPEVYVRPFPRVNDSKSTVSLQGGIEPVWAHSGRELYYRNQANELVAAAVSTGAVFTVHGQRVLFSAAAYRRDGLHSQYDVAPGDSRFVMIRERVTRVIELTVVQNFIAELKAQNQPD